MSGGNKRRRKKCPWNICHLGINVVQSMLLCICDNAQLKSEEYYINLIRFCQFDRVVVSQKSPIHIHVVRI